MKMNYKVDELYQYVHWEHDVPCIFKVVEVNSKIAVTVDIFGPALGLKNSWDKIIKDSKYNLHYIGSKETNPEYFL